MHFTLQCSYFALNVILYDQIIDISVDIESCYRLTPITIDLLQFTIRTTFYDLAQLLCN